MDGFISSLEQSRRYTEYTIENKQGPLCYTVHTNGQPSLNRPVGMLTDSAISYSIFDQFIARKNTLPRKVRKHCLQMWLVTFCLPETVVIISYFFEWVQQPEARFTIKTHQLNSILGFFSFIFDLTPITAHLTPKDSLCPMFCYTNLCIKKNMYSLFNDLDLTTGYGFGVLFFGLHTRSLRLAVQSDQHYFLFICRAFLGKPPRYLTCLRSSWAWPVSEGDRIFVTIPLTHISNERKLTFFLAW